MTAKNQRNDVLVLKNVRLSFPKLFEKVKTNDTGVPKYSLACLMDPETKHGAANIQAVKDMQMRIAKSVWKDNAEKVLRAVDRDRRLLRNGEHATNQEGDVYAGYEGMNYITASSTREFKILNRDKSIAGKNDQEKFYGGCYADVVLACYAITDRDKGGNGLFASIEIVRWRADGEPFGAAPLEEDDYLDDLDDDEDFDGEETSGSMDDDDDDMI